MEDEHKHNVIFEESEEKLIDLEPKSLKEDFEPEVKIKVEKAPEKAAEEEEKPVVEMKKEASNQEECDDCPYSKVQDLIYWRDLTKTGVVFGASLCLLLSMTFFSIISVLSYILFITLLIALSFRIYKYVLQAVQKSNEGHPFKQYLELDLALSSDDIKRYVEASVPHLNCTVQRLRSLFLVEDVVDSGKLLLILWGFTYLGSWFNGMTLVILADIGIFSLPKVYETYKKEIDSTYELVINSMKDTFGKIRASIPIGNKKKD